MRTPENTPWFGPAPVKKGEVEVAGKTYVVFECHATCARDGIRLWPATVLFARHVADRKLKGPVCEVGAGGHGLPGQAAGASLFVEQDNEIAERLELTLHRNHRRAEVFEGSWSQAPGQFDSIIGSEILYPLFDLAGLAAFVARAWTRKGPCLFCTSGKGGAAFKGALAAHGIPAAASALTGTHPDGRPLAAEVWEVRGGD